MMWFTGVMVIYISCLLSVSLQCSGLLPIYYERARSAKCVLIDIVKKSEYERPADAFERFIYLEPEG